MKNYFKKFSVMFVMSLMFIGIGMIQNGSTANAATIGQSLTAPESGWRRYDDTDSKIQYIGTWHTSLGTNYYYGGTMNYSLKSENANSSAQFSFYGNELRIIGKRDGNSSIININIDGTNYVSDNTSTSNIWQALIFEKCNLNIGVHNVIITNIGTKHIQIDALDINKDGYLVSYGSSIAIDESSMDLTIGDSSQLTATIAPSGATVTWTSSDSSIGTVDSTGKVTGVAEGTCTITATTPDGLTATCTVTVTKENKSISLNKSTTNLTIDDSETLIATTTPAGINVKWSSSDTSVATVDSNGKVTAIGTGIATIIATTLDGSNLSASCLVTVAPKENDPTAGSEYITNIAHAKGTNTNNPGGDVTIIFHGSSDTTLSLVKTADVKDVWIGDNFTYTLVITNTGTKTAKAVVVNDPAPNHIDFNVSGVTTTQGTVDSSSTSKNIIVNVGDILPGGTVTIKIPSTVIA
ncbi:putative repeat protein (TIGR01451 family) [Clostridium saccharoperbutylacetonicum]|uniref:BIG2 domain-containing protein n=1 Tax=Clostridium saccharoperbutylacetonicum N1-4(HMT) TaxID=931276 RepID=M1MRL9_9CLOT|nr:Ig-like domain-containing protein [Clostridium saccharoperbutylacetonicum]AGF57396.1 hypothetical protein Cspa_c36350 [Clostridium saccharoperbutylacetonicum N1-4(HMT)]NRT61840.1 putative repeat protein (TIGR01451 family) [Clostridium saccharoperbutylacetonicum]NSB25166.1 putative repeat protein (TIGR01451 family) [Clostridium saccharoperbutylacetonicum]NSB44537.1 putative repeat protein (TIGR01451 family) [Clostridium saccharoperbutylacetonicum]